MGLITGTVVAAFVLIERRAAEPVIPLHLFTNRNFNLTTAAGLITGIAMFGALAYMPTYLQMVTGVGATPAGFLMIPMMGALLLSSIISGQIVSNTGRYKAIPIIGTVLVAVGLTLLSTLLATTAVWIICVYLAIMGVGLGMSMQILILVVQNSFPVSQVGTATASNNFFRQIGSSLGSAIVGSLFVSRLTASLAENLPAGAAGGSGTNSLTPAVVNTLPQGIRNVIVGAYNESLTPIFLSLVPLVLVAAVLLAFVLLAFVQEKPLATTIDRGETGTDVSGTPVPEVASAPALAGTAPVRLPVPADTTAASTA